MVPPAGDTGFAVDFDGIVGIEDLQGSRVDGAARFRGQAIDQSGDADHLAIWNAYKRLPVGANWVEDDGGGHLRLWTVGGGLLTEGETRLFVYQARTEIPREVLEVAIEAAGAELPFAGTVLYELEIDLESWQVSRRCPIAANSDPREGRLALRSTGADPTEPASPLALGLSVELTPRPGITAAGTPGDHCTCFDRQGVEAPCVDTITPPPAPLDCSDLPAPRCEGSPHHCHEILLFEPRVGPGWEDVLIRDERPDDRYRSYLRRDLTAVIKWAATSVACLSRDWPDGNGEPLVLADMSEADGATPGDSRGRPTHPAGSHTMGNDVDVGYYQTTFMPDNEVRPVCPHLALGNETWHCVEAPDRLDVRRTALLAALIAEQEIVRCIGVDGAIGPLLREAQRGLFDEGVLTRAQLEADKLCYETEDTGRGWYRSHHDHMHISAM